MAKKENFEISNIIPSFAVQSHNPEPVQMSEPVVKYRPTLLDIYIYTHLCVYTYSLSVFSDFVSFEPSLLDSCVFAVC